MVERDEFGSAGSPTGDAAERWLQDATPTIPLVRDAQGEPEDRSARRQAVPGGHTSIRTKRMEVAKSDRRMLGQLGKVALEVFPFYVAAQNTGFALAAAEIERRSGLHIDSTTADVAAAMIGAGTGFLIEFGVRHLKKP